MSKTPAPEKVQKAKAPRSLDALETPKNRGDGCIAIELKELKSKVSCVLDILASSVKSFDATETENAILLDFSAPESPMLVYTKTGSVVTAPITARVFKPGAFVVNADILKSVKATSPFIVMAINTESNAVEFRSGNLRGSMQMLATAQEFKASVNTQKPKTVLSLPKSLITNTFSNLLYNSFDPGLPAAGLPLSIVSDKTGLRVTTNDNLVGAVFKTSKTYDAFQVCVPGNALVKIVKHMPADTVRVGFDERSMRVRSQGLDVTCPLVVYDLVDIEAWITEEETHKPEFELLIDTASFETSIENALCLSGVDKSETKVTIELDAKTNKGKVVFIGASTSTSTDFTVKKYLKTKENMNIITNGKRLASFVHILKVFPSFRLRVRKGRAFLYAPDDSLVYMVPLS
jgi:hypothetical protein